MKRDLADAVQAITVSVTALRAAADEAGSGSSADLGKILSAAKTFAARLDQFVPGPVSDGTPIVLTRAATHDLLNPLNQIIGYAEMLLEELEESEGGDGAAGAPLRGIVEGAKSLAERVEIAGGRKAVPAATDLVPSMPVADALPAVPAPTTSSRPLPHAAHPILVVDDDELNRDLLTQRLERQGFTVLAAEDGVRALEILERQPIDLVLLDVLMPQMNGYQVLERMQANPALHDVPVLMISGLSEIESVVRCIEMGATDYLPKPFNPVLLQARIGACLEKKQLRDQERRTFEALEASQRALAAELSEAADYVRSLLSPPVRTAEVSVDWRFIPSMRLGGDAFGYQWIDPDHLTLYLFDVCGHGVGAALLSVAVIDVLRSGRLHGVEMRDPGAVLGALNDAFPMELHNGQYFTMWYGVYDRRTRTLEHSSGGHPPAVLLSAVDGAAAATQVWHPGMIVGGMSDITYGKAQTHIPPGARLYLFSDGLYEVTTPSGVMSSYEDFVAALAAPTPAGASALDRVVDAMRAVRGADTFEDDLSIMEIAFA